MDFALAAESIRVIRDAHVFFTLVTGAEALHALLDFAHAGGAKTIASARVLHGDTRIECDLENGVAFLRFYDLLLAAYDKPDLGHGGSIGLGLGLGLG